MSVVFRLMDGDGLPLDVIQDLLAERGLAFNVVEFCRAALESGNYTPVAILEKLRLCAPPEVPNGLLELAVERAQGLKS